MGIFCPVCGEAWLIYNSLCVDCRKIKHTLNLVGKERFLSAIDTIFIIGEERTKKILEKEAKQSGVITRTQALRNSFDK
tara:strand:- start:1123 stop:1359 length:237 start_codon:yes stop_codon:yes gene_type:complete